MANPKPTDEEYDANPFCGYCDAPLPPRENGIAQWSSDKYAGKAVWLCVECHYLERCETNPDYAEEQIGRIKNTVRLASGETQDFCTMCYLPLSEHDTKEKIASCLSHKRRRYVRSWIGGLREKIARGTDRFTTEADIAKYRRIVKEADPRFK
jgi:Zn-finger protein